MIAIPNMEKPKSCFECFAYDGEFMECRATGECVNETFYDKVLPDCPLIDIVHCKDCKWLGVDEGMPFCYWWLREIEPDVFCSYGERRSDE